MKIWLIQLLKPFRISLMQILAIQLCMAVIIAIFIIRALRAFEFHRQQELATARLQVQEEIPRAGARSEVFREGG